MPPSTYGGTELVVHLLTEALVRRGHEVTLFATGDSVTSALLESVVARPYRYGGGGHLRHPEHPHLANAQACFLAASEGRFDIVHNHAGLEGMALAAWSSTPVLTTAHLPYEPASEAIWDAYPWFHHALSTAGAATFPVRGALAPVHHGIDVASFPVREEPVPEAAAYLAFLGRMAPEKGASTAIEVARRTGRRLVIAGKVDTLDRPYYDREVRPGIDGDRVRFVGELDGEAKRAFLAGADALLFPVAWDEPFGLVLVEALACGTPVVAFGRGAVPEIVEHGRTGYVVEDVDAMVEAVHRLAELSRTACRAAAAARFDVERMVDAYEARYAEAIERGPVGPVRGSSRAGAAAG